MRKIRRQTEVNWIIIQYRNMLKEAIKPGGKHSVTQNHEYFTAYSQQHFETSEIHITLAS